MSQLNFVFKKLVAMVTVKKYVFNRVLLFNER